MKKIALGAALLPLLTWADDPAPGTFSSSFSQTAFLPDISFIVDASYVNRNKTNDEVAHLEIPGVAHGLIGSHSHGDSSHATYNASEGFNLNYAELALSSSVDPYFTLDGVLHISEDSIEIEEAYFTTTSLPYGFRFRGGKFLSDFGYINSRHAHVWDFADMPLVYQAFLGDHGIDEIGAQLQYLLPTSFYWMVGGEALQGSNEMMFGNATIPEGAETDEAWVKAPDLPALYVAYTKASFDIGDTTLLGGLSYARGATRLDHLDDEDPHAFAGMSSLYGADLVVKHYFDSYRYLKWQSEWLYRDMDGTKYVPDDAAPDGYVSTAMTKKQAGYYTQLVYAFDQNWRIGGRFDSIYRNDVTAGGSKLSLPDDLHRYTAMIDFSPSEFSRFRLQYNHNDALYNEDGERQNVDTVILQANIAIGAHGAHSF